MKMSQAMRLVEMMLMVEDVVNNGFDPEKFAERVDYVMNLMKRGATEGERDAARHALMRLLDRAKQELTNMSGQERMQFASTIEKMEHVARSASQASDQGYGPVSHDAAEGDVPVPTEPGQTLLYAGGNGVYAEVKRVRHETVKRGRQDEAYFVATFRVQASEPKELENLLASLGFRESNYKFFSPDDDLFKTNWASGKATTELMPLMYPDLQKRLKTFHLEPTGEAPAPPSDLDESAPPGKEAETWIKHRKAEFKERYGKRWKQVLYAKAWKLFGH